MKAFIDCGVHKGEGLKEHARECDEVFLFECDPDICKALEKEFNKNDLTGFPLVFFRNQAVWNKSGEIDFYKSVENTTGGTVVNGKMSAGVRYADPIKVPAIDFSQFLKSRYLVSDYVIVKLDIEGAEYQVIRRLIDDGTIWLVDELLVEFHHEKVGRKRDEAQALIKELLSYGVKVALWDKLEQRTCV